VVGQVGLAGGVQVLGLPGDGSVLQAGGQEADMTQAETIQVLALSRGLYSDAQPSLNQ
jgi:hypothetical protein